MESFWKGAFLKHRDYAHSSVVSHLAAQNGRDPEVDNKPVKVDRDPITEEALDSSKDYYKVTLVMHGAAYTYLIVSATDGPPTKEEIVEQIEEQMKHRVDGGRDIEDYIALEDLDEIFDEELDNDF